MILVWGGSGGGSVQVQVSSITWVQHVSLTSWTYIYNPSLMIFSSNLTSFHSKPLWSVICILAPTGWKLCGWDFFFFFFRSLTPFLFCIFSLTHSLYLGLVNSSLPPQLPPSLFPPRCAARHHLFISAMPQNETNKLPDRRFQSRFSSCMWSVEWTSLLTLAVVGNK